MRLPMPSGYCWLMAFLGAGAVVGVFLMPALQRRIAADRVVGIATAVFAACVAGLAASRLVVLSCAIMFVMGANWVVILTNFNIATQLAVPAWVKGRAMSLYLLTLWGSWALGAAIWGWLARATSAPGNGGRGRRAGGGPAGGGTLPADAPAPGSDSASGSDGTSGSGGGGGGGGGKSEGGTMTTPEHHTAGEHALGPDDVAAVQRRKLAALLEEIRTANPFYRAKLDGLTFNAQTDEITVLPFTTRQEVERDQLAHPSYGSNLTYPLERYNRFHQTSGSGGQPVRWLDTPASWAWFGQCWQTILKAAGVKPGDRMMFPFSFGPFVGFWAAFESAAATGDYLCLPAGGMTSAARLKMLIDNRVDIVFCTPTYALRLAEEAAAAGIDLAHAPVRALIVAGEPGGSIPAVRGQIESAWGARVFDHSGMTEMGAVGYECAPAPLGLHVIESQFIAEVIDPATARPVRPGETGELVLTNLGRWGSPLIRYRTGDIVRLVRGRCACGSSFARLDGGILGRADDMFIVRGNNVFPSAVESVLRNFPQVAEFRLRVYQEQAMTEVLLEIEPASGADAGGLAARGGGGAGGAGVPRRGRAGRAREPAAVRDESQAVRARAIPAQTRALVKRAADMKPITAMWALVLSACLAGAAMGADWTQWRGPEQTGVSREKNLPDHWSPDPGGDNLVWTDDYGGMSSPIVMKGKVYTFTRTGEVPAGEGPTATLDPGPHTQERWCASMPPPASCSGATSKTCT